MHKMRGNLEAAETALGPCLRFVKYALDAFEQRRQWLEAATADEANPQPAWPSTERRALMPR